MKARYWSLGAVLGGLAVAGTAWAALDCGPLPDCEELGFTDNVNDCAEEDRLNCPFDDTSVLCRKKGGSCEIGSILYNDLNCYASAPDGLIAVGVVVDDEYRLAVSLDGKSVAWSPDSEIIPGLKPTDFNRYYVDYYDVVMDGKADTKQIVDFYGEGTDYAAGYCYNYTTPGTEKGDWFLPSFRQAKRLRDYKSQIDAGLKSIGGQEIYPGAMWTSTTYFSDPYMGAWALLLRPGDDIGWPENGREDTLDTRCRVVF